MDRAERFKLYERLHFHELERREKIGARLALPFAGILATAGLLSFMLNATDHPDDAAWQVSFWALFLCSVVTLLVGALYFRKAWFGHTDQGTPTAEEIEKYHGVLVTHYAGYPGSDGLVDSAFDSFLFNSVKEAASVNTINNDARSTSIYRANRILTLSVLLALFAAVAFYGGTTFKEIRNDSTKDPAAPTATTSAATSEGQRDSASPATEARALK